MSSPKAKRATFDHLHHIENNTVRKTLNHVVRALPPEASSTASEILHPALSARHCEPMVWERL